MGRRGRRPVRRVTRVRRKTGRRADVVIGPYGVAWKRTAPAMREARSASASGYRRWSTDYHTTSTQAARKYSDAISTVYRPGSVARIYNSGLRGRRRLSIRPHPRGYGSTQMYRPPLREPTRRHNAHAKGFRAPNGFQGAPPLGRFLPFATFRSLTKSKSGK